MPKNLNRGRLTVVLDTGQAPGARLAPAGMRAIGTVIRAGAGATLAIGPDGTYFAVYPDGHFDPLPARKIQAAIDAFNGPTGAQSDSGG